MTHLLVTPAVGTVVAWKNLTKQESGGIKFDPLMPALQHQGYCVASFKEENEVLQAVLENVPDLLIIYLQTAGEKGYEFCKILRKLPRTSAVPVVFVGTRDSTPELVSALRCGGDEYVQLPMSEEECWLRLERHLRTVRMVRSLEADRASLHQKIWSYNHILRQHEEVQVSLAKENQALQRLAFTDGLTKVANRRSFNEKIPQLWQQAKELSQPISLLLCDIDYFKRYNDTYGHLAGDVCLQAVADALVRGAHRQHDQVARYGGEEFAILLPGTDSKGAQQVALAVQSELARAQVPHSASLVKPYVSLSIGICTLEPALNHGSVQGVESGADAASSPPYEVLIHGADEALYTAKLRGRDRAVVNSPEGLISLLPNRCHYSGPSEPVRHTPAKLAINTNTALQLTSAVGDAVGSAVGAVAGGTAGGTVRGAVEEISIRA